MTHRKAVVFAYHTVGVKCLDTLLDAGFEIPLVITHQDATNETIWFLSVRDWCERHQIPFITPENLNSPELIAQLTNLHPDYLFSFYYRFMIPDAILKIAKISALNMHGSLLPKYRGRVPINWAVLHGETETGATLHVMASKPDAGDIVHQKHVAILPDETAHEVFLKVVDCAALTLKEMVPQLLTATFPRTPNRIEQGSYFGGRKPEDGLIDWNQSATSIYNLIRAVAPPYPGAFTYIGDVKLVIGKAKRFTPLIESTALPIGLGVIDQTIIGRCGDANLLEVTQLILEDHEITAMDFQKILRTHKILNNVVNSTK